MKELYSKLLLEHARQAYGAAVVPRGTEDAEVFNPACGDEIRVKLYWTPEKKLERLHYELQGCAISRAAASLAARKLEGRTPPEIETISRACQTRLGRTGFEGEWGDFQAFNGIEQYPARIHCARLVWRAVDEALKSGPERRT